MPMVWCPNPMHVPLSPLSSIARPTRNLPAICFLELVATPVNVKSENLNTSLGISSCQMQSNSNDDDTGNAPPPINNSRGKLGGHGPCCGVCALSSFKGRLKPNKHSCSEALGRKSRHHGRRGIQHPQMMSPSDDQLSVVVANVISITVPNIKEEVLKKGG